MSAVLARSDFIRAPVLATARPDGFKEWYHFVVHRPDSRILINFSLNSEVSTDVRPRLTPRVIVIAHDDQRWTGGIERFEKAELDGRAALGVRTGAGTRARAAPG